MNTQEKILNKLLKTAEDFGYHDAAFSLYDCHESMHSVETSMEVGNELAELIDLNFFEFVESDPAGNEAYIRGYVSAVESADDLPEDLNEGGPSCLNAELTPEAQNRIRELVAQSK